MAVQLYEKIEISIASLEQTTSYPITVKLEVSAEDEKAFGAFKDALEEEYKQLDQNAKAQRTTLKEIGRLSEDEADLSQSLEDDALSKEAKKEKVAARSVLRSKRRALEDTLEDLQEAYAQSVYADSAKQISEAVAKKSFELHVVPDEQSAALQDVIEKQGIAYTLIVTEMHRLIKEAKQKK